MVLQPNAERKVNTVAGDERLFSSLGYGNEAQMHYLLGSASMTPHTSLGRTQNGRSRSGTEPAWSASLARGRRHHQGRPLTAGPTRTCSLQTCPGSAVSRHLTPIPTPLTSEAPDWLLEVTRAGCGVQGTYLSLETLLRSALSFPRPLWTPASTGCSLLWVAATVSHAPSLGPGPGALVENRTSHDPCPPRSPRSHTNMPFHVEGRL